MTKQNIERLFEHIKNEDIEYVVNMIDDKKLADNIKDNYIIVNKFAKDLLEKYIIKAKGF